MSADDLTKLRVGLAVVFAFTILGLVAELCYVLWRRRAFQRQSLVDGEASDITSNCTFSSSNYHQNPPSKELLYFFCWKSRQSRIEPADGIPVFQCSATAHHQEEVTEPADQLKLQEVLYGPPRMLFTIKEEDHKEEPEVYSAERSSSSSSLQNNNKKRVCLEECFNSNNEVEAEQEQESQDEDEDGSVMVVNIEDEDDEDLETPFSTPCGSPSYYTPTPSPARHQKLSHTVQIDDGPENHFDDDDDDDEH